MSKPMTENWFQFLRKWHADPERRRDYIRLNSRPTPNRTLLAKFRAEHHELLAHLLHEARR